MKPQLAAILLFLVCLPLGLLVWLGEERTRGEQERARASLEGLLEDRLLEVYETLSGSVRMVENHLTKVLQANLSTPRAQARTEPMIRHMIQGTTAGDLVFPLREAATDAEEALYRRLDLSAALKQLGRSTGEQGEAPSDRGWHTWYHGHGRNFLYWWRNRQEIRACEVNRMAFLSHLIAALPTDALENGRIALLDESAQPIYQWGSFEPAPAMLPVVTRQAPAPLDSWRLAYFLAPDLVSPSRSNQATIFTAMLYGLAACILLLGGYFYWAYARELREASQRVSFVNQVSHELKTPLTNIRMYAELAESKITPEDDDARACLDVVVAESGRLSRLIQNVLTFATQQRGGAKLHPTSVSPDDVIRGVLESFGPALEQASMIPSHQGDSTATMRIDRDVLEQILSNLVSNVLKYASEGAFLRITSTQAANRLTVTVIDEGPGIPSRWRARIFAPFVRMSDRITEGAAGTGIGLTIARDLARAHGGDLVLEETDKGATFTLTLTACS